MSTASAHNRPMTAMQSYIREIPALKYLLCLGVVIIHLFLPVDSGTLAPSARITLKIWNVLRGSLASPCLWAFFVVSGMLYFRNGGSLDLNTYLRKTKSRVRSLLVPYLLWNAAGCVIFLIKVYGFGYPGSGIVDDGRIDIPMLLRGFWCVGNEYPFDSPLWFIRDLFVISLLSPIIGLMARYPALIVAGAVSMSYYYPGYYNRYAFIYFAFGAWLALHPGIFRGRSANRTLTSALALWVLITMQQTLFPLSDQLLFCLQEIIYSCAFAVMAINLFLRIPYHMLSRWNPIYPSAFFVFALHCFYTGTVKKIFIDLIGLDSGWSVAAVVVLSFITVMTITTSIYLLCRKLSPRLTYLLSGGRG